MWEVDDDMLRQRAKNFLLHVPLDDSLCLSVLDWSLGRYVGRDLQVADFRIRGETLLCHTRSPAEIVQPCYKPVGADIIIVSAAVNLRN